MTESELLDNFKNQQYLLKPLVLFSFIDTTGGRRGQLDAIVEAGLAGSEEKFRFIVEAKAQNTPMAAKTAIAQVRAYPRQNEYPLILLPYLSPELLDELEREQISGVDLCGNGIVVIQDKFYILRTGQPNLYKDSRPLNNPYRGRSALVSRVLLKRRTWESLSDIVREVVNLGGELSLPQASKAIASLQDDLIVAKSGGSITLVKPQFVLYRLGREWRQPPGGKRQAFRLQPDTNWATLLSNSQLKWSLTGESSVTRYTAFSQGGPKIIAVSNLAQAVELLAGKPEPIRNFADLELFETKEDGYFFDNEVGEGNIRWASRLQTWLELQAGDARQQDAAEEVRAQIMQALEQGSEQ